MTASPNNASPSERLRKSIKQLDFKAEAGTSRDLWVREVIVGGQTVATIKVDLDSGRIECPAETRRGRDTCLRLLDESGREQTENLVTLDCYIRLLETGYSPALIELEKAYKLGHDYKGYPDLVVYDDVEQKVESVHMVVECKTAGKEYESEIDKMRRDGGQLMSYWAVAQTAAVLVLFTSDPHKRGFGTLCDYEVIQTTKEVYSDCRSATALFAAWDQQFDTLDIFAKPYNREFEALSLDDLRPIDNKASDKIFLDVLELLRLYSVSDKQNAFMKIINLLIAKVYDETHGDVDFVVRTESSATRLSGLMFQVTHHDDLLSLQQRLLHQYNCGMRDFLGSETFNSRHDFLNMERERLQELVQLASDFHFAEVYDPASFAENGKILAAVVKILQPYRFKNQDRDQILGDLFERFLNTAIKQEAGQFFTPMPLVDFMLDALPLEEVIESNLRERKKLTTPAIIDYSCGSGHFIISALQAIHHVLQGLDAPEAQRLASAGYDWAGDSVYGVEKDYRLAKTTKISTFLNGDGQANVIHADGLDSFTSPKYTRLLSSPDPAKNGRFDMVVANPPYSVDGFVKSVAELGGSDIFTMFDDFGPKSTAIETLFIERTGQLLHEGGHAALILPGSIVNSNDYTNMRRYLLQHFTIKALVYLGTNTFSDTSTSPVILFLERAAHPDLREDILRSLNLGDDQNLCGVHRPIQSFLLRAYPGLAWGDYCDLMTAPAEQPAEARRVLRAAVAGNP